MGLLFIGTISSLLSSSLACCRGGGVSRGFPSLPPGSPTGASFRAFSREGSGKSTLAQAMFRLREPCNGSIYIDGVSLGDIGLADVRRPAHGLCLIPQAPILFRGSIRYNLSPFDQYTDAEMWRALELVNMKSFFIAHHHGSNSSVSTHSWTNLERRSRCHSVDDKEVTRETREERPDNDDRKTRSFRPRRQQEQRGQQQQQQQQPRHLQRGKRKGRTDGEKKEEHALEARGLDTMLEAAGENLSVGQRQLLCLARALLRRPRILVMDEATASVDSETDSLIQQVVETELRARGTTVIEIAHRLHSVMSSHNILVLDQGEVAEFGPPSVLAARRPSQEAEGGRRARTVGTFAALLESTGERTAAHLRTLIKH